MKREIKVDAYRVTAFLPDSPASSLIVLHTDAMEGEAVWNLLTEPKPLLLCIDGTDWERDFSPTAAPRAFHGGTAFSGGAPHYLETLTARILPQTEAALGSPFPQVRGIAGYSLAGLFAVYAAARSDFFTCAASMSGSLWFDDFAEELTSRPVRRLPHGLVLSLGDREANTKNARLSAVAAQTRRVEAHFRACGTETVFVSNPGGHFDCVPERIAAGIGTLCSRNGWKE